MCFKRYKLPQKNKKKDILGSLLQPLEPFLPCHTAISFELPGTVSTALFRVATLLLRPPQVRRKNGDRRSWSRKRGIKGQFMYCLRGILFVFLKGLTKLLNL